MRNLQNRVTALFVAAFAAYSMGMIINRVLQSVAREVNETRGTVVSGAAQFDVRNGKQSWHSPLLEDRSVMNGIDIQNCQYAEVPNDLFVPIFVMTRDRVSSLQKSLQSYWDTIQSPYEIFILDHNSSFPPMVNYLQQLAATQNVSVIPLVQEAWGDALKEANQFIRGYLDLHPHVSFYVYTDPDIAFMRSAPDILLFYAAVLSSCPEYKVVGPGLQISDIPSNFTKQLPNGQSVRERHSKYWKEVPNIATWNGIGYHVAKHPIDTTFAMFRRNTPFERLTRPSLRAYAPYAAVHVDWYDDSSNLPADKIYYMQRQSGVNNW